MSTGFWALVLTIKALALAGKTEVLMPSLTYRRLDDAVLWAGLNPRFCDVEATSLAVSPESVERNITDQTALILAPHPIVNCCDAPSLEEIAYRNGLPIVFDSVESVYERIRGRKVGSFGNAEVFSLHASKLINGFEGGYVTTNDEDLANRIALIRGFGFNGQDNIEHFGINAKLNELHAAMALASLEELPVFIAHNKAHYERYKENLGKMPGIRLLPFDEAFNPSYKNIVAELTED
jgi:dTDP-4-amino-4,6-dideoxygalactose transaminase